MRDAHEIDQYEIGSSIRPDAQNKIYFIQFSISFVFPQDIPNETIFLVFKVPEALFTPVMQKIQEFKKQGFRDGNEEERKTQGFFNPNINAFYELREGGRLSDLFFRIPRLYLPREQNSNKYTTDFSLTEEQIQGLLYNIQELKQQGIQENTAGVMPHRPD
jgi:hypothetical protein